VSAVPESITSCRGSRCLSYRGGHHVHPIQARKVGESPWGWRDATITAVDGLGVHLAYVEHDAAPVVWHHRSLAGVLHAGAPVRLHEQYFVLGCPAGWFSVQVEGGLGAVTAPEAPELWSGETSVGIVEIATGNALPTDHRSEAG
jgi:hypothetical protein